MALTLAAFFHLFHLQAVPVLGNFVLLAILLNIILAIFNLIPIPPLDGSHILKELLPRRAADQFERLSRYGFIILLLLIMTPVFKLLFLPAHALFWLLLHVISMFS